MKKQLFSMLLQDLEPIPITRSIPKGSPMPALSVKKRSQRGENHFWRGSPAGGQAFLACRLGLFQLMDFGGRACPIGIVSAALQNRHAVVPLPRSVNLSLLSAT